MVLAGTGKKGKTKEVVKDREGKTVGMYVCMYVRTYVCMYVWGYVCMRVRMYVCSCMCVTKVRVKDAACQRWSWRWWHRGTVPGRTKCHACHAEVARRHGRHGRLNQDQARHPVPSVPRLPRKTTVDVRLCHACHVKRRWMSPSATPATQKWRGVTGVTGA